MCRFITFTLSIYEQTVKSNQKPLTRQNIAVIIYTENNDRQKKRRKKGKPRLSANTGQPGLLCAFNLYCTANVPKQLRISAIYPCP